MKVNPSIFLTDNERQQECTIEATKRVDLQLEAIKKGDRRADYSYGEHEPIYAKDWQTRLANALRRRSMKQRLEDALMGTLGECIACKCAKCKWTKELGQYADNRNPDLRPMFRGKIVDCDSRGTGDKSDFIFRPRDAGKPEELLIATINLGNLQTDSLDRICEVGHIFFGDLAKLVAIHPEWEGHAPGAPYFRVPFQYLSNDFSEFGS